MVHGKILALEIYFLLILLIQYNIILIMINFRYIILLFANKQWGTTTDNTETRFPINFNNQLLKVFITSIGKASSTIAKEVTITSNNSFMVYTNPKPGGGSYYFVIGS